VKQRRKWAGRLGGASSRWSVAAAAAFLFALLLTLPLGSSQAQAAAMVRAARDYHTLPLDHCYDVRMEIDPVVQQRFPMLVPQRETRLFTRGDRFWIQSKDSGQQWGWGRDDHGRLWLASTPKVGVRFEPHEVPAALADACDIRSVKLQTLLSRVLKDFDVAWDENACTIRAFLKTGRSPNGITSATLVLDPNTRRIDRLEVERELGGRPIGRVTFTYVRSLPAQDTSSYGLEGHLDANASVFTHEHQPLRRLAVVAGHFANVVREQLK
jgi:hypothetical protein